MSFYDDASLVLIPSGIKASKVYSQKPTSGTGDLTFSRASTATRTNSAGLIESVASNVPRLDYSGGATCPSLLLEPQRTNLALQSEAFDNASWIKGGTTVTANTAISPDGTQDADTIALGAGGFANIRQVIAVANNTSYTVSCYYKNIALTAGQTFEMRYTNELLSPNNLNAIATIDLFAGTVSSIMVGNIGTGYSGSVSSTITNVGNGWYRVTMTFTVGTSGANNGLFRPAVIPAAQARTFYAWGAQVEAGAFVSSYIPTTTAAVTRLADACNKTGISSLIGQTEGTFYAEINASTAQNAIRAIGTILGTGTYTRFRINTSNALTLETFVGGSFVSQMTGSVILNGTNKVAFCYKNGEALSIFLNGTLSLTGPVVTTNPAGSEIRIGTDNFNSSQPFNGINQVVLFPTRLTNAQILERTTL